jgi:hypothetical protein
MPFVFKIFPVLLLFLGGQVYFLWQASRLIVRKMHKPAWRGAAVTTVLGIYAGLLAANLTSSGRSSPTPTHMTLHDALISAPFLWWIFSSTLAFFVVILVWLVRWVARAARAVVRRIASPAPEEAPRLPERRQFLEGVATAAVASPFVAGAYVIPLTRVPLSIAIIRPRIKGTNAFRPRKTLCILNELSITDPTKGRPLGSVRLKP